MIVVKVAISLDCSSASSTPVRTVTSLPSSDWIRCVSCSGVVPVRRGGLDRVELAFLVQQLLRRRHVEDREGRPADRAQVAVLGDADDLELLRRPERGDADPVSELQVLVVGDALVDRDLVAAAGPAALDEVERVEAVVLGRGLDAEGERRRAAGVDRLAVRAAAASSGSPDRAGGDLDAVDLADAVERLLRDRRRLGRLALEAEAGVLAGHDGVRAGVRVDEDRVERLVDRVREDVGAAHHRDAEHDRERGQRVRSLRPARLFSANRIIRRRAPPSRDHGVRRSTRHVAHDLAVGQEQDPIGDGRGSSIVRDHHRRLAELVDRVAHEGEDLAAGRRVEVAGRLVGEDHGRPGDECAGDRDPLLLAAGELGGAMRQPVGQADLVDQVVEPVLIGLLAGNGRAAVRCSPWPSASAAG